MMDGKVEAEADSGRREQLVASGPLLLSVTEVRYDRQLATLSHISLHDAAAGPLSSHRIPTATSGETRCCCNGPQQQQQSTASGSDSRTLAGRLAAATRRGERR